MSQWPPNPTSCKVQINQAEVIVIPQFWDIEFRFMPTQEQYQTINGKQGYWLCQIDPADMQNIVFISEQAGQTW